VLKVRGKIECVQRERWELKAMQSVVKAVIVEGVSKKAAAKQLNVPRGTLQRLL